MNSIVLSGPWPRNLTADEIEDIKANAMIAVGERIAKDIKHINFGLGDQFTASYTLHCGTKAEKAKAKLLECGELPPNGGPACRLDRGHNCEHSSVVRW